MRDQEGGPRVESSWSVASEPYRWPWRGGIDLDRTALMCIDWQTDFCGEGGFIDSLGYDISLTRAGIEPTRRVQARARELGMTVIHTREGHRPDLSDLPPNKRWRSATQGVEIGSRGPMGRVLIRGELGWEIVPELAPLPGETVIDKPGKGAFYATDLDHILRLAGITDLIITGITTDVCVSTTVREANDRGFEVLVLSDCTAATNYESHLATIETFKMQGGLFAAVTDAATLLAELAGVNSSGSAQASTDYVR